MQNNKQTSKNIASSAGKTLCDENASVLSQTGKAEQSGAELKSSPEEVLQFMRNEIYPRLVSAKNDYSNQKLKIEISPPSPEDITVKQPILLFKVQDVSRDIKNFLRFEPRKNDSVIDINCENGSHNYGMIFVASESKSATTIIETYIKKLFGINE